MYIRIISTFLLGFLFEPFVSKAQSDTTAQKWLEEVVVSAQGTRQQILDVPVAVSRLSTAEITSQSGRGLPSVLNLAPGVFTHQGTINTNRITIRGIGARVPYATGRLRTWIDEVPLTNGAGYSMLEYIDPLFISEIEISRSPTTILHGASLGGTIVLSTVPDQLHGDRTSLSLKTGSFGQLRQSLSYTKNTSGGSMHKVFASYGRADGWRENNSHFNAFGAYTGQIMLDNKMQINALLIGQHLKAHIPSSIDSATFVTNPRAAALNWKNTKGYENGNRMIGGITLRWWPGQSTHFKTTVYGHAVQEEELRPFDMFHEERRLGGWAFSFKNNQTFHQLQLVFSGGVNIFTEQVKFVNYNNTDGFGTLGNRISENAENIGSFAVFMQTDAILQSTTLIAGVYLQNLINTFNNNALASGTTITDTYRTAWVFSPRLAVNHRFESDFSLFASMSHGFAPPALSETLDNLGRLNPEIKPEQSITLDLGAKMYKLGKHFYAEAVLFRMHIRDLLVAERIDSDLWVGRNAGSALHKGIEISTLLNRPLPQHFLVKQLKWKNNLNLGDYRFTNFVDRGADHSGKKVPGIPTGRLNSYLSVSLSQNWSVGLMYEHVGRMAMNDANTKFSKAYSLMHLNLNWQKQFKTSLIEVFGQANNLTNTKYASMILVNAPGQRNQRWYYPGLPLHFELGLQVSLFGKKG